MNRRAPIGFPPLPRDGETDRENHKKLQNMTFTRTIKLINYFLSILSWEEEYKQFKYEVRIDLTSLV